MQGTKEDSIKMDSKEAAAKPIKKRTRDANWTETEKKVFLDLCRPHEEILGKKAADPKTGEEKAKAWQDISDKMSSAGYERSKEKLKRKRLTEGRKAKNMNAGGSGPVAATNSTSTSPQQPDSSGAQASTAKLAPLANTSARRGYRRKKQNQTRVLFPWHNGSYLVRIRRLSGAAKKRAYEKLIGLVKKYERMVEPIIPTSNYKLQMRIIS